MERKSLASVNPELSAQWHPDKNGDLTPYMVAPHSHKKVWWCLPYDDPKTGKHFFFEWQAKIDNRSNGRGCPFLSGEMIMIGFNDLNTVNQDLANEWHPTKNLPLTPEQVTASSGKKVWWLKKYDDPYTGKTFNFEWQAAICDRNNGKGCPYLTNRLLFSGFNDLATKRPELVEEWDNSKNRMSPDQVLFGSHQKVWWKCKKGHSWFASVEKRSREDNGCPHCAEEYHSSFPEQTIYYYFKKAFSDSVSRDVQTIGTELDIYVPSIRLAVEYDGSFWHKDSQKDKVKNKMCKDNNVRLIRIREKGCPQMNSDVNCTVFEINNNKSLKEILLIIFESLNVFVDIDIERDKPQIYQMIERNEKKDSLLENFPLLAAEWHPTKNGNLKPEHVKAKSGLLVWWYLPYDDELTGHHNFEWQATISSRTSGGNNCPFLSGAKVCPQFNSLSVKNSELANEWDYELNANLRNKRGEDISTPDKISPKSDYKVWWKCRDGHKWKAAVKDRTRGRGCPECYKASRKSPKIKSNDIII